MLSTARALFRSRDGLHRHTKGVSRFWRRLPTMAAASFIGRPDAELPSPSFVVRLSTVKANCARLAAKAKANGLGFRPHVKVQPACHLPFHMHPVQLFPVAHRHTRQLKVLCCKRRRLAGNLAALSSARCEYVALVVVASQVLTWAFPVVTGG